MKTIGTSIIIFLLFFTCPIFSQDQKPTAAVMDLEARGGVSKGIATNLSDYLRTQLFNTQKFTIVDRENMEQVLKEQKFQLSGCTSQKCIVQAGQLLGVRKMFSGSIGKVGKTYLITLKIIDVESGKIDNSVEEKCAKCEEDALFVSIESIAYKITGLSRVIEEQPEGKGKLSIFSTPDKTRVILDGEEIGLTPVQAYECISGKHQVVLIKEGYEDYVIPVEILKNELVVIKPVLKGQTGSVNITSIPAGAQIFLNNEYKGITPIVLSNIPIGEHLIVLKQEDCKPLEQKITILYKKELKLNLTFLEEDGSIVVASVPSEADVYIDNTLKGKTPLFLKPVSSGMHSIKVSKSGYADTTTEIIIRPNKNTYYSAVLEEYKGPKLGEKEITWQKDNSIMILIPAGEFLMGSPDDEGENDEHPQHKVYLDAYYIDKYEVTNQQFAKFLNEWGKDTDENGNKMIYEHDWGVKKIENRWQTSLGYEKHPVINVTWYGAAQYAKWAGKRLPTEAEWEKAARAGSTTKYCYGNNESTLTEYAWYTNNSGSKTHPVGEKKPNAFGIYDMHGNVWEWCSDWYDGGYYKNSPPAEPTPVKNPQGPSTGGGRIFRGGSWVSDAGGLRSANRVRNWPVSGWVDFGFRCVSSRSVQ